LSRAKNKIYGGFFPLRDVHEKGSAMTKLLADVTWRKKIILEGSGWRKIKG
jgi:hypothetical protein